ncbi:hypothetical protein CIRMBP1313_01020 [Enterococcus cecorum]|nr:hypothetical protein CIRMBP1313_01020 [Enterococcus cecorum]
MRLSLVEYLTKERNFMGKTKSKIKKKKRKLKEAAMKNGTLNSKK